MIMMFRGKSDTFILGHDDMTIGTHFTSDGRYLKRRVRFCSQKRCNRKKIILHISLKQLRFTGGGGFVYFSCKPESNLSCIRISSHQSLFYIN